MSGNISTSFEVSGSVSEPGLNGIYNHIGRFRSNKNQWMKPNSRCYIRWIRNRWELYVSHHPNGTTYFYHEGDTDDPPQTGWKHGLCVDPSEKLVLESRGMKEVTVEPTATNKSPSQYTLYVNKTCPYAQQVLMVLRKIKISEDIVAMKQTDIFEKDSDSFEFASLYHEAYPHSRRRPCIPMLVTPDDGILVESSLILDYLTRKFPTEDLPPSEVSSAMERYQADLFVYAVNREVVPCISRMMTANSRDRLKVALSELKQALICIEEMLLRRQNAASGPYFGGDRISLTDIRTVPHFQRLVISVSELRSKQLQGAIRHASLRTYIERNFPTISDWLDAVFKEVCVQSCWYPDEVKRILAKTCVKWAEEEQAEKIYEERKSKVGNLLMGIFSKRSNGELN